MNTPTPEEIKTWQEKAANWDTLDQKIASCYFDKEGNEREDGGAGLDNIGEYAAAAFGYL